MTEITPIGVTNFRNEQKPFGIKDEDRFNHIYVIGKTGTGKSTLLLNVAISDIQKGNGICLIDPHGDLVEEILNYIPRERINDVVYFNPADESHAIAFNPIENIPQNQQHLVVAGLIATFKKIWVDSWGPRLEYILRYSLLCLLTYPGATLLDIQPFLTNYPFRKKVLLHCTDQYLTSFWYNEFDKYSPQLKSEAISPILNKAGLFVAIKQLRSVIGQANGRFTIPQVMDRRKVLICNLAKGKLGEDATALLGSMIINAVQLAALGRASQQESLRIPFYLYVDEMHSFISLAFADILAEARKYKLSLFLAHQYIEQIHEKIRFAIFGNIGTMIIFRVGAEDAKQLEQEMAPSFLEEDLLNLPRYSMYIKLMIDGATSRPFSANTTQVLFERHPYKAEIIALSQINYSTRREVVEHQLMQRYKTSVSEFKQGLFE